MGRNYTPSEIDETCITNSTTTAAAADEGANGGHVNNKNDQSSYSIRDRLRFKRNPIYTTTTTTNTANNQNKATTKSSSDRSFLRNRFHHNTNRSYRKGFCSSFPFRGVYMFYFVIFFAVFAFAMASMVLQSSITELVFTKGWSEHRRSIREGLRLGTTLKFFPGIRSWQYAEGYGLDQVRLQGTRVRFRAPRLAIILGSLKIGPQSLMLISVMKNLQQLGYVLKIYAMENGKAQSTWEQIGGPISILQPKQYGHIEWSIFEAVIVDSLEGKEAILSLMQEPFCSIPLIWIIQEDTLANRLSMYEEMGWECLVSHWKRTWKRANVVVFSDFTMPMLYTVLDTGNFFVIPGSPMDVWAAEKYSKTHAKYQLRTDSGFSDDDIVVVVLGSSFFYDELSWDYAVAMHSLGPLLVKYARRQKAEGSFKFIFLCGNSTDGVALQEVASRLGLLHASLRHYGLNDDVNSVLLMADIVIYGSSQDEQGFPPLIIRAMTFGVPVIAPDIPIIKKYVVDGVHGLLFQKHNPEALMRVFSLLISDGKLSRFAQTVASSGKLIARNMLASECITGYARLLENFFVFPSGVLLPSPSSHLQQMVWEWNLFRKEIMREDDDFGMNWRNSSFKGSSIVYNLEEKLTNIIGSTNSSVNGTEIPVLDLPTESDWDVLREIDNFEEYERVEMEELEERMDKNPGVWDDLYRNARKSERLKFEANERDEGELERTGKLVCIYEIYNGAGAWPFLHHGSLYRGLSLSTKALRSRSDDVDAVARLPILNDSHYRNVLCEIGGMFSVANKVDNIHKRPWIGFQSWHAAGRKVSLSSNAEKVLEEMMQKGTRGDVMYFWACLDVDMAIAGSNNELTFWSICDMLNGRRCRTAFAAAFRQMYALPQSHLEVLPPMPKDGGHWSALHSWVMPTSSFLEFVMFARMFVDSLDALQTNSSQVNSCLLSSSQLEEKHCYCRILELLVNVWAYHSAREMVYINPKTGSLEEQHPIEQRREIIWAKYFNLSLLKGMDEDLAEAADDGDYPRERWLWPLTGEVHWQGIYEREREKKYRQKMEKKRKYKEKIYERHKLGYKQKPLGG